MTWTYVMEELADCAASCCASAAPGTGPRPCPKGMVAPAVTSSPSLTFTLASQPAYLDETSTCVASIRPARNALTPA